MKVKHWFPTKSFQQRPVTQGTLNLVMQSCFWLLQGFIITSIAEYSVKIKKITIAERCCDTFENDIIKCLLMTAPHCSQLIKINELSLII
jgi:hypothetical protein